MEEKKRPIWQDNMLFGEKQESKRHELTYGKVYQLEG